MKTNQARQVSEQAFNELVSAVDAGKSQRLVEYLKAMGKFHKYSLGNAILIGFQKPDATHVAGFRTWKRLGRHVKKGENGIAIMAPIIYRKKKPEDSDNKESEDEEVRTFKTVHVFDISQTDGKPLSEFARVTGDPGMYTERLRKYINNKGIVLEYSDTIGSAEGISVGGLIILKKGLTTAEELSVLSHEIAHERLHVNKDNRPKDKKVRETEAEAVAFVVCHAIGMDTNSASSDYIQLYNGDKQTLMESLERIQKTASEILEAIMDKEFDGEITSEKPCMAVAA
jgi:antirestriction protein ArdC